MELTLVTCGNQCGRYCLRLTGSVTIAERGEVSIERAVLIEEVFPPRLVFRKFIAAGVGTTVLQKWTGRELVGGDPLAGVLALVQCHTPEGGRPLLTN